jgi:hypothetical protein
MIEIEFDPKNIIGKITELQRIQIPRAGALALNQAVFATTQELKSQAKNTFSNPVPFTQNAFLYKKASPELLEAKIFIRDEAPKGNPPSKYLLPQIYGGKHYPTRFQGALLNTVVELGNGRQVQVGQRGQMMIPNLRSPKVRPRLNQYGNMSPGQYTQILSALRGNLNSADVYGRVGTGEARANDQQLSKYIYLDEEEISEPFFRRRFTNSPRPGIYAVDRRLDPKGQLSLRYYRVMTESRLPTYSGKFKFLDIARSSVEREFAKNFSRIVLR